MSTESPTLRLIRYSEKALAVVGPSKQFKDSLKDLGGRWNSALTINGKQEMGWIFSRKSKDSLEALLKIKEEDPSGSKSASSAADASAAIVPPPPPSIAHPQAEGDDVLFFTETTSNDFIVIGRNKTFKRVDELKALGGVWTGGFRFPNSSRAAVDAVLSAPEVPPSRKRSRATEVTENADNGEEE